MRILNLGCGTKTCAHKDVTNIDWSVLLRIRTNPVLRVLAPVLLKGDRLQRFRALPSNIMIHDLARGIPFVDRSVDVVYHSHVLEHLDREVAIEFIRECGRVLRPGGWLRIVVPDFERYCREYLADVERCSREGGAAIEKHDAFLEPLLLMSVRREAHGTSTQGSLRRRVENFLLGDARKRGETHQWMYDRFNLSALLLKCGFVRPIVHTFDSSSIPGWVQLGLDTDSAGREYKPESLYVEAVRGSEEAH